MENIRYIIQARKLDVNYVDPETGLSLLHVAAYHGVFAATVSLVVRRPRHYVYVSMSRIFLAYIV